MITDHERAKLAEATRTSRTSRLEQAEALLRRWRFHDLDASYDQIIEDTRAHLTSGAATPAETPFAAGLLKTLAINRGQSDEVLARGVRGYLDLAALQPLATCEEHGAAGCEHVLGGGVAPPPPVAHPLWCGKPSTMAPNEIVWCKEHEPVATCRGTGWTQQGSIPCLGCPDCRPTTCRYSNVDCPGPAFCTAAACCARPPTGGDPRDPPCDKCGREVLTVPVTRANGKELPPGCRIAISQKQLDEILAGASPPLTVELLRTTPCPLLHASEPWAACSILHDVGGDTEPAFCWARIQAAAAALDTPLQGKP